jgi:hypothetical protein
MIFKLLNRPVIGLKGIVEFPKDIQSSCLPPKAVKTPLPKIRTGNVD